MSWLPFSPAVAAYLERHAIDLDVAHRVGVRYDRDTVVYPYTAPDGHTYEPRRDLNDPKPRTKQPPGEPLSLWWPVGRTESGSCVLLCELPGPQQDVFEPERAIGLKNWGIFVLERIGAERTRLLARGRAPSGLLAGAYALLIEIPHFIMERRMLLGIKERAELSTQLPTGQATESRGSKA